MDTWVRSIVTETDSALLLLRTVPEAFGFYVISRIFLLPTLSAVYAIILTVTFAIESIIPRSQYLRIFEDTVEEWFNVIKMRRFAKRPPRTKPRVREAIDVYDAITYIYNRWTRWFMFFYLSSQNVMGIFMTKVPLAIIITRTVLISFCKSSRDVQCLLPRITRGIFSVFFGGDIIARHQRWFARTHHMLSQEEIVVRLTSRLITPVGLYLILFPLLVVWTARRYLFPSWFGNMRPLEESWFAVRALFNRLLLFPFVLVVISSFEATCTWRTVTVGVIVALGLGLLFYFAYDKMKKFELRSRENWNAILSQGYLCPALEAR